MSKAFTREDAGPSPLPVMARAPLPAGVPNYVTARGLRCLREEWAELHGARTGQIGEELQVITARMMDLGSRIATAQLVEPPNESHPPVRFGATVTVRWENGSEHRYQIVGVDEADAQAGRIAFVAPLARALLGKRPGDHVAVRTPAGSDVVEVIAVRYEA